MDPETKERMEYLYKRIFLKQMLIEITKEEIKEIQKTWIKDL